VAKKIGNDRSMEKFEAALNALLSPNRTARVPLRRITRDRTTGPANQADSH
jgi:hypothetical protein